MALGLADLLIYRALLPRGEARFWGSRPVVDPRVNPMELARRTGASRTAIQVRLDRWKRIGFWLGYEVWPNPRILGAQLATVDVPVHGPAAGDILLDRLSGVDGVVSARDYLDEGGRSIRAFVVYRRKRELELLTQQIQEITDVPDPLGAQPYWTPETVVPLSGLDWRIIAFYRAFPEMNLSEASVRLGITPKTLSHRRDRLIESRALWWLLSTNSVKFPAGVFQIRLRDPRSRPRLKEAIEAALPAWIPCADDGFGRPPSADLDTIAGLAYVESPGSLDDVSRLIGALPGVSRVLWRVPRSFRSYRGWFDGAIEERLAEELRGTYRETPHSVFPSVSDLSATKVRGPVIPFVHPPILSLFARPENVTIVPELDRSREPSRPAPQPNLLSTSSSGKDPREPKSRPVGADRAEGALSRGC
jgi:DNA-binding Lrp family transcriptional regulator